VASVRGENRSVQEEDKTGYVHGQFRPGRRGLAVRGDVGVRYVKTKQTSTFYTNVPDHGGPGRLRATDHGRAHLRRHPAIAEPGGRADRQLLIRFSARQGDGASGPGQPGGGDHRLGGRRLAQRSRPATPTWSPIAPRPDFSVEWYPKRGVIVSAAYFYKKISTYVQTITTVAPYSSTGLPVSLLDGTGVNANDDFSITNVVNTPGGPLKGFELNYQQPLDFLPEAFKASACWPTTPMSTPRSTTSPPRAGAATVSAPRC
jgi:iron complex outermembrane receptor protein